MWEWRLCPSGLLRKEAIEVRNATWLTLIALGAILAFAVNGHPSFLNIQVVGWVIMATGAVGVFVPDNRYAALRRRITRKRSGRSGQVTEVDERVYPPYIALNRGNLPPDAADTADLVASKAENEAERVETVDDYYYDR
jgi:hypothetical protein